MNRNSKLHNLPLILFGMFFVMLVGIICLINGGFILTDYEDSVAGVREEAR